MEPLSLTGRKCQCCNILFHPAPNNRGKQRFCWEGTCRRAAKACANGKWRRKNPGYDRGPEQVERVREWRAEHPGYSRGKKGVREVSALQDFAPGQGVGNQALAGISRVVTSDFAQRAMEAAEAESCSGRPLQDFAPTQDPLVVGLISVLMGGALQDNFAVLARGILEQGRRVLARNPGGLAA